LEWNETFFEFESKTWKKCKKVFLETLQIDLIKDFYARCGGRKDPTVCRKNRKSRVRVPAQTTEWQGILHKLEKTYTKSCKNHSTLSSEKDFGENKLSLNYGTKESGNKSMMWYEF